MVHAHTSFLQHGTPSDAVDKARNAAGSQSALRSIKIRGTRYNITVSHSNVHTNPVNDTAVCFVGVKNVTTHEGDGLTYLSGNRCYLAF